LADHVSADGFGYAAFSASIDDLVYWQGGGIRDRDLTWYDRQGKVLGQLGEPGDYSALSISPDGKRVAFSKRSSSRVSNIWLRDLPGDATTRFTFGLSMDTDPVWSPDGTRIIFSSNRDGLMNLYQKETNGTKNEEVLLATGENKVASSWSPD